MMAGRLETKDGLKKVDLNSAFEGGGKILNKEMSETELERLVSVACPGCGSCSGMFTANTMNCLTEALGMGLPGNGTIPAVDERRWKLAWQAGEQVMKLLAENIKPKDIINDNRWRMPLLWTWRLAEVRTPFYILWRLRMRLA
jgi:dihydroxy-acid dehydratase